MAARKYTEEEMKLAKIKRKIKNCERLFKYRQAALLKRFNEGDQDIKKCECGKYFDKRVHNNLWPDAEREWCTKCPMRPMTRERKYFKKLIGEYVTVQVKR